MMNEDQEKRIESIMQNGNDGEHYKSAIGGGDFESLNEGVKKEDFGDYAKAFDPIMKSQTDPETGDTIHYTSQDGPVVSENYKSLSDVLDRAYAQAATGKGHERHGGGKPFDKQPMQDLMQLYGVGFALGQAAKKAQESQRMDNDAAVRELLGAINYLAGAVIFLESGE